MVKKVASTPLTTIAKVVDSLSAATNDRTNTPSVHAVREAVNNNWLNIYPIGSIYMSVNNADLSLVFGGTWERIKDRFLLSSGDQYTAGATAGSYGDSTAKSTIIIFGNNLTNAQYMVPNYVSGDTIRIYGR